MTIRGRIVLPFLVLFAAAFGVTIAVAVSVVSRGAEARFVNQARDLARMMPGFPVNEQALARIREAFSADVAVMDRERKNVLLSTLEADDARSLERSLGDSAAGEVVDVPCRGRLLRAVAVEAVFAARDARAGVVVLLFPADVVAEAKRKALEPLILTAAAGGAALLVIGVVIAHRISRPIVRLADAAGRVAAGDLETPVAAGGGGSEIERLTGSFNTMLRGLRQYREDLVKSQQLADVGHMAAAIAHEIRNPLTTMKMSVQMLARGREGRDREPCDDLLMEIERLELAVAELFSAARASKPSLEERPIRDAVEDVLRLLDRQLAHLGVRVEKRFDLAPEVPTSKFTDHESGENLDDRRFSQADDGQHAAKSAKEFPTSQLRGTPDLAPTARIDEKQFKRAIMNLVMNGAQACAGNGTVTVALGTSPGGVEIAVGDTGPGIPEEIRDRLFDPFVTTKRDGIGLGLTVTKRIIEDHGGTIRFATSPRGTTFFVTLPI